MRKPLTILDHAPQTVQVFEKWLSQQPKPVKVNVNKAITLQAIKFCR